LARNQSKALNVNFIFFSRWLDRVAWNLSN
jgi:hypothetical protein